MYTQETHQASVRGARAANRHSAPHTSCPVPYQSAKAFDRQLAAQEQETESVRNGERKKKRERERICIKVRGKKERV